MFLVFLLGWQKNKMHPIFLLGSYFGESTGMYFAWMFFYTSSLIWLTSIGILLSIFELATMSINNLAIPFYCVFVCIWISVMSKMWKRRESELAFVWNTSSYIGQDMEREDFDSQMALHPRTLERQPQTFQNTFLRAFFLTIPTIFFGLALLIAAFIGYRICSHLSNSLANTIIVGAVNGVGITILTYIYYYIAKVLTDWENHRYHEDYQNSYIVKIFGFQFVNCYISLFAIAFYDVNLNNLAYSLITIFVAKNFLTNIIELILPIILHKYKMYKLTKKRKQQPISFEKNEQELENNYIKSAPSELVFEYCEMFIQLGYISLFSCVFPLASIFALLNNLWEIGGEAKLWLEYKRRPNAECARSIGQWNKIMKFLIVATIIVNAAFLYISKKESLKSFYCLLNTNDLLILFVIVVIFEHAMFFIDYFL